MKGAFSGFTKAANNKHNGSGALWAKLRRGRLHHSIRNFTDTDLFRNRKQAWQTVPHLGSNTRARFDTTRQLLRSETPTSTILALYKLSSNLPRRDRRQAHKALQTVLRKRRLSTPPATKPIYVQPLMHPTFRQDLRQFLRTSIQDAKRSLLPFHIPSTKAVFKKHPPIQQILHNWRQAHSTWQPQQEAECTCASLRSTVDSQHLDNNHIAIQLAELQPQHRFLIQARAMYCRRILNWRHSSPSPSGLGTGNTTITTQRSLSPNSSSNTTTTSQRISTYKH